MEKKVALLINWVGTFVSHYEFRSLFQENHKENPLINDKYHRHYEFVRLLNEVITNPKIEKIIIYGHGKISMARNAMLAAGIIIDNSKIEFAFFTNFSSRDFSGKEKRIDKVISRLVQTGMKDFIIIDTMKSVQALKNGLYQFLHKNPSVRIIPIIASLFGRGWYYYKSCSEQYGSAYYYADSAADIRNFIAYYTNIPEKAVFMENITPSSECQTARWYMFHYYATSRDAIIKEQFSIDLRQDIKDETISDSFSLFFFKALEAHICKYIENINECAFVVLPSHTKDKWNNKLIKAVQKVFIKPYGLPDLTRLIKRNETVPKQSVNGRRSLYDHVRSLSIQAGIPESIKYIFLLDDITTTGGSFQAAATLLKKAAYKGAVLPFAIAGTQSYGIYTSPIKHNIYTSVRPFCNRSYIFDLDGTLIDSSIAKDYRDNGSWKEISALIPQMKPYRFLVEEVKKLIIQNRDVAIVTSAPRSYAEPILRYLGIIPESVILICYHDTKEHKPYAAPYYAALNRMTHRPAEIFCFGDMVEDIIACKNANSAISKPKFKSILVSFSSKRECIPAADQDYTCNDELDCIAMIRSDMNGFISEDALFRIMSLAIKDLFFNKQTLREWSAIAGLEICVIEGVNIYITESDNNQELQNQLKKNNEPVRTAYSLNAARHMIKTSQTDEFRNFCSKNE